jgi:transcriptional regulator with XRE-family HTH domain
MTFADRVRAILNVPGWTQERLGAEVGVKQATVSRWLDGADPKIHQ